MTGRVHVRHGRRGRALRVGGSHASHYRPGRISAGPVWDALAVPFLSLPKGPRRSVAILGLGGGSAARLLRHLAPDVHIVGVERDEAVVDAAVEHFALGALDLEIVVDDALAWLRRERRRFDLVIEDVFVGAARAIRKPEWLPEPGLALAAARVRPDGLLVSNTIHEGAATAGVLKRLCPRVVAIDVRGYWNRILVGGRDLSAVGLRRQAATRRELQRSLRLLRFRRLT